MWLLELKERVTVNGMNNLASTLYMAPWLRLRLLFVSIGISVMLLFMAMPLLAETITWYQPDFPPYVILNGPYKEFGIDNRIVKFVVDRLPEYKHSFEVANYMRILDNLKKGEPGIVTPLFRTPEREKFVHYTNVSSYLVFPNGFIYRKSDYQKYIPFILEDGTLDIEALCRSGQFRIGINSGRSYHGILDDIITKYRKKGVFFVRSAIDHLGAFKMVANKRVDAAFGFPVEIKYYRFDNALGFLHVSKMNSFTPVFFGAPKNTFGAELVDMLNFILDDKKIRDQFAQYYMYWLDDEMKPDYEKFRQIYYNQR